MGMTTHSGTINKTKSNMKRKKMDFTEFQQQCQELYEMYRHHYALYDVRIWNKLPGEVRKIELFYLVWSLRKGCDMMLVYDRSEAKNPFLVYVDWKRYAFPHPFFEYNGEFVLVGEYPDMETAIHFMLTEPTFYRAAPVHCCTLHQYYSRGENADNTALPVFRNLYQCGCSLLEMLEEINYYRQHDNEKQGTHIYIKHDRNMTFSPEANDFVGYEGDTVYETML